MRVAGRLRIGNNAAIDNLILPMGPAFPPDEDMGELFYLREHPTLPNGVYVCQDSDSDPELLVWKLLVDSGKEALEYPIIELGCTESIEILYDGDVELPWDYQAVVDTTVFHHSTDSLDESSQVTVKKDGLYQISYSVNSSCDGKSQTLKCSMYIGGDREVGRSGTFSFRDTGNMSSNTNTFMARIRSGSRVSIKSRVVQDDASNKKRKALTIAANCSFSMLRIGEYV